MGKSIKKVSRAEYAFQLEHELRDVKVQLGTGFIEMGRILKDVRDNKYYVELGYETITEWFSSPDISLSPSWAWNFIAIYETFILKHQIPLKDLAGIDYTKLQNIVSVVNDDPKKIHDWIDKARELRRIDLKREVQEYKVATMTKRHVDSAGYDSEPIDSAFAQMTVGDPNEAMRDVTNLSVDCIITTPPVVVTQREFDMRDDTEQFIAVPDYNAVRNYYYDMVSEFNRVLINNRSLFVFGNVHNIFTIGDALRHHGFTILRDIIWFKRRVKVGHNLFNLVKSHETILWARKGTSHINNLTEVERDVWEITNKDILTHRFVEMATYPKHLVYDPFIENDTTMDLINGLDRRFVGNKSG